MSTITSRISVALAILLLVLTGLTSGASAQHIMPNSVQVSRVDHDGNGPSPITLTATANGLRVRAQSSSLSFGAVNVGTAATVQTLTYTFTGPATLSAVTIVTSGAS